MIKEKRDSLTVDRTLRCNLLIIGLSIFVALVIVSCASPSMVKERSQTAFVKPPVPLAEGGVDQSSKCFDCHNYQENHHPIDVAPSNSADLPFPLFGGKIKCLTCHQEDHAGGRAKLLRGGPYNDRRDICFTCHFEDTYDEIDPHIMLDDKGKDLMVNGKPVCLFCHTVKPDPAKDRSGDVRFKADIAFLCWRCHTPMADSRMFDEHFLAKPPLSMLRFIEKKEQELKITMPLVPRDRITCSTCHNPHQKGVILYGPSVKGSDAPGKLRVSSPAICLVCHEL